MNRYSLFLSVVALGAQLACTAQEPIALRHPANLKTVQCADEQCASQYEAAGYVRLSGAGQTKTGDR